MTANDYALPVDRGAKMRAEFELACANRALVCFREQEERDRRRARRLVASGVFLFAFLVGWAKWLM